MKYAISCQISEKSRQKSSKIFFTKLKIFTKANNWISVFYKIKIYILMKNR